MADTILVATPAAVSAAKARANHTGTQASTTISDFTEAVQDAVAGLLGAGSNIVLNYNDVANTLTVSSTATGGTGTTDLEAVRDAIGVALVGVGNIAVTVNDTADTITISTTATANRTDATTDTLLNAKAPLASPTFTGTVTVPTPAVTGAAANMGYVDSAVAAGGSNVFSRVQDPSTLVWPNRSGIKGVTPTSVVLWLGKDSNPPANGGEGMGANDLFVGLP